MYLVFDTSVLIAATLTPNGLSSRILHLSGQEFLPCTSDTILEEFTRKMSEKSLLNKQFQETLQAYRAAAILCDNQSYSAEQISNDNHIIGCWKACGADMIVALDKKLLKRLKTMGVPAAHPSDLPHYYKQS